jgi:hypothetical protein
MSTITTRSGKGSPLTHAEVDANFNNLNTDKIEDGDSPSFVNVTVSGTVDGRDIAVDGTKLDGIEASADVTDATNVTAAGALMDSELTSEASVKALNQGVATTDSPSFAGLTTTADISFGDNDKAIFGAGSDLQIYHNGTNSLIEDVGTGDLYIRSSNEIRLQDGTNTNYFYAIEGGKASLYYNGNEKIATTLTGVDVTGTVVSDGLTVDTNTLAVDSTNNRVGIGTTSPANKLEVTGAIVAQGAVTAYTNTGLYLQNKGSSVVDVGAWRSGASVAELSFSTDSGSDAAPVERMRINSSGNVGIGTTSPLKILDVSSATAEIAINSINSSYSRVNHYHNGTAVWTTGTRADSDYHIYRESGSSNVIIDQANVGIGTSSPASLMHLSSGSPRITLTDTGTGADHRINADSGAGNLAFDVDYNSDTASPSVVFNIKGTERTRINSSGNLGIGTTNPTAKLYVAESGTAQYLATFQGDLGTNNGRTLSLKTPASDSTTEPFTWQTGNAIAWQIDATERMRLDGSGNVGIGTSSPAATVDVSGNARGAVVTDNDLSFNLSASNNFSCTPSGAGTLTFTNHLAGQSGFVWLDNSGGHAISAAATTKINAADLTAISTAGVYTLVYFDNGTNAYVSVSRSFA